MSKSQLKEFQEKDELSPNLTTFANMGHHQKNKHTKRKPFRLYSSQAYCGRQAVLESNFEGKTETDLSFRLYVEMGNLAEQILKTGWQKEKILLAGSYRLPENDIQIKGEIDAIVKYQDQIRLIEIKTVDTLPDSPKHAHYYQALTYSCLTGLPYTVYYLSRNIVEYEGSHKKIKATQFDYDYNVDDCRRQIYQLALSYYYGLDNNLPPIPAHVKKSHCGYCRWKGQCWDGLTFSEGLNEHVDLISESQYVHRANLFVESFMSLDQVSKRRNLVVEELIKNNKKEKTFLESFLYEIK